MTIDMMKALMEGIATPCSCGHSRGQHRHADPSRRTDCLECDCAAFNTVADPLAWVGTSIDTPDANPIDGLLGVERERFIEQAGADDRVSDVVADTEPLGTPAARALLYLESKLTLHEGVEMDYIVDGYEVALITHDGATATHSERAPTLLEAITKLREAAP